MSDKMIKKIKYLAPDWAKKLYRKTKREVARRKLSPEDRKPLSIAELECLLDEHLKISPGDTVIVHSSFGNLNPKFSPTDAVNLLKEMVSYSGNILMPYYPTGHAYYWVEKGNIFDVESSKSCMGILTEAFKNSKDVKLSPHPVKAMAVWGKDRDFLISEHDKSVYPFDKNSPYYKTTLLRNSKTVGLGIEINSFVHCCEDLFLKNKQELYSDKTFELKFNYYDGGRVVETYLHEPHKVNGLMYNCEFLKLTGFNEYKYIKHKGADYYSADNQLVMNHLKPLFFEGTSRTSLKAH